MATELRPRPEQAPAAGALSVVAADATDHHARDREVAACGGTVFHTAAWARYRCADGRGSPLFLQWQRARAAPAVAVALAIVRPPRRSARGHVAASLQIDGPPCAPGAGEDFVTPLVAWARRRPAFVEIRLGSYDERVAWQPGAPPRPHVRLELVVTPERGVDPLDAMRKMARRAIRRAERRGVTVGPATAMEDLDALASLYAGTVARLRETKGVVVQIPPHGEIVRSLRVLVASGAGHALLAREGGRAVAGCAFAVHEGAAYHLFNGASRDGLDAGAVPLTFLTALRRYAASGYDRVNLGGVAGDAQAPESPDHGLYEFKAGLGGQPVRCTSGHVVLGRLRSALIARVRR
jgi:hypothetical protein